MLFRSNDLAFVTTYLGALWAGAVAIPLNPQVPSAVIADELAQVEARVLVCGAAGAGHLGLPGAVAHDALAPGAAMPLEVERDDDEVAVLLYTSGTAGMPKAAMLTHGNLAANIGQVLGDPGLALRAGDRTLGVLPFFHVFGLNVVLGVAFTAAAAVVTVEPFDAARTIAAVREQGGLVGIPHPYDRWRGSLLRDPALDRLARSPHLRRSIIGERAHYVPSRSRPFVTERRQNVIAESSMKIIEIRCCSRATHASPAPVVDRG